MNVEEYNSLSPFKRRDTVNVEEYNSHHSKGERL